MANNQTTVRISADASGYTTELERAAKRADAFIATQDAASKRVQAAQAAIAEAATNGSNASTRAINRFVTSLSKQAEQAGKTQAEMAKLRAAQLGISDSVSDYIEQIENAAKHTEHFSLASTGARRELLVLAHEASQGNWKRFGGSLLVLGERTDALSALLSPVGIAFGVVAGAAALFTEQIVKGAEETEAFNKAISSTNGFIGLSAGQLAEMSNGLQTNHDNLTHVREALAEVASTGAFAADSLALATQAALAMSSDIGIGTDKAAESLAKIQDNVLSWTDSYQRAHHTFSAAQIEEIDQFVKLGDTASATNAVMRDIVGAHEAIQKAAEANMGPVLTWWHALGDTIDRVGNAIKNIAVPDSIDKQVGDQYARVEQAQKILQQQQQLGHFGDTATAQASLNVELKKLDVLRQQQTVINVAQRAREESAKTGDAKAAVDSYLRDRKYATPSEKHQDDLGAENTAFAKATQDLDHASKDYQDALKKHYAAIEQINADYATRTKPKGQSEAWHGQLAGQIAANQLIEAEEKRNAATLKAQRDLGLIDASTYLQKLHDLQATALDQEIANAQTRVDIAKAKPESAAYQEALKTLTDLQAQRKQADDDLTIALQRNAEKRATDVQKYSEQMMQSLAQQQADRQHNMLTMFMSPEQKQQADALYALQRQQLDRLAKLQEQYGGPTADKLEYEQKRQAAQAFYEQQVQDLQAAQAQEQTVRDSYSDQIRLAMQGIAGETQTSAQLAGSAFSAAFSDMNSALESFVTTGKFSFSSFASSVMSDMAKIALKAAENQIFSSVVSAAGSAFSDGGSVGHYAGGGAIAGAGSATSDSIPSLLSNGEYVVRASQAQKYRGLLDSINYGKTSHFASGGVVGSVGAQTVAPTSITTTLQMNLNGGGSNGLTKEDLAALAPVFQTMIDKRMAQRMSGQGGFAYKIRHGQM